MADWSRLTDYEADAMRCASANCDGNPKWRFEAGQIGSPYCQECKDRIDDQMFDDDESQYEDDGDYRDLDCGLRHDGQCSQAGTEHCDFMCPNRNSDLFVGSAAWRAKHERK